MNRLIFIISFLIVNNILSAQADKEFWFAIPKETSGHGTLTAVNNVSFKITALSLPATVTLSMPANPSFPVRTFTVPANQSRIEVLANDFATFASIYNNHTAVNVDPLSSVVALNRGFLITADNDITVYYDYDNQYNRELFSLKGKNALGTEFYTPFQTIWNNGTAYNPDSYASIEIVATEDNTVIDITPPSNAAILIQGRPNNDPFTITLNRGQSWSLRSNSTLGSLHPAGTHIASRDGKKIAVIVNDDSLGGFGGCYDVTGDQLVPTDMIGSKYLVMPGDRAINPGPNIPHNNMKGEQIFILATQDNTTVTFRDKNGTVLYAPTINQGKQEYYSVNVADTLQSSIYIETDDPDKKIYVWHISAIGCEIGAAILPPITNCTGSSEVSFYRSSTVSDLMLNLMVPYDTSIPFSAPQQSFNFFTLYYSDGTSPFNIPGSWFEPNVEAGWVTLKKTYRNANAFTKMGQAHKIVNTQALFHLGIINGQNPQTNKYGYFSSFKVARPEAYIASTGTQNFMACYGDTVKFIAKGGLEYSWHYGTSTGPATYLSDPNSASPTIINCPSGSHDFYVEIKTKCATDVLKVSVVILPAIEADITLDKSYLNSPGIVTITNNSTRGDVYTWNKQTDTGMPVNITPADNSSFQDSLSNTTNAPIQVRYLLQVSLNNGCTDTISKAIIVYPEVKAGFALSDTIGCSPLAVTFTDASSENAVNHSWSFGDNTNSNEINPTHQFTNNTTAPIDYAIKLVVENQYGVKDSISKTIMVLPKVTANILVDKTHLCAPDVVSITNNSTGGNTYTWTKQINNEAPFVFSPSDNYFKEALSNMTNDVMKIRYSLRAESNLGCIDTTSKEIIVYPAIDANFSMSNTTGCSPLKVNFTNTSGGNVVNHSWSFGDGNSSVSTNPTHSFVNTSLKDTIYRVRLVGTSAYSCADTFMQDITVHPQVISSFSADKTYGISPLEVTFNNNSTGSTSSSWNFGDGTIFNSTASGLTHVFINNEISPVIYLVKLATRNSANCMDTSVQSITVYPKLTADFSSDVSTGKSPLSVQFTNKSVNASSVLWSFGDNSTSTELNPIHQFINNTTTPVDYKVHLSVSNQYGVTDSITKTITVLPDCKTIAKFKSDKIEGYTPLIVNFKNLSTYSTSYLWDFNDNVTSMARDPRHEYINNTKKTVEYEVKLKTSHQYCSSDSTSLIIRVWPMILSNATDIDQEIVLKYYPNPAKEKVYLQYPLTKTSDIVIELIESSGKIMKRIVEEEKSVGQHLFEINIESLRGNLLFIKITAEGKTSTVKVVKE